uniref:ZP domain-containing protein n=1 Tax=Amphiprion ocellaris TaxID=80972 RepID=A0A3Q1CW93_AMPOC
ETNNHTHIHTYRQFRTTNYQFLANSDIEVFCGSQTVDLQILLCPIYFNGYNESLLALNSEHSKHQCKGAADWTADPPIVKFSFSISEEAIIVSQEMGTGQFADFSNIQHINISGMICSKDPTTGAITYHQEVMYRFSCRYPLQYMVNNTQMSVAGTNLAVKDKNGSFISTLSIGLYSDNSYSSSLNIPQGGLELKTRIFVEVKASNLTNRFNVLLDRCYATTSLLPINTTFHDLFVGCNRDGQTVMGVNGEQQKARFSFEAFRFVQSADVTLSTYYVHCATRLCVNTFCPTLIQVRIFKKVQIRDSLYRGTGQKSGSYFISTIRNLLLQMQIDPKYILQGCTNYFMLWI